MKHEIKYNSAQKRRVKRQLTLYEKYLIEEERSPATVEKYVHIVRGFLHFAEARTIRSHHLHDRHINKEMICSYKQSLIDEGLSPLTVNGRLSAIRSYLRSIGREDIKVRNMRCQRSAYVSEDKLLEKREYERLIEKARQLGKEKHRLIIETICASGIRVSELRYITVEAAEEGRAQIKLKGKIRIILIPDKLRKKLIRYARTEKISEGAIFRNRKGGILHRSYVWQMMKEMARKSGVDERKVFPHNLRRLFARTFYRARRDIAKLADILGHTRMDTTRIYIAETAKEHVRILERLQLVT